jgi:putative acetyltransferase
METEYPKVKNPELVGNYSAIAKAGGGYVWDHVLEYRVWCHPHNGAEDFENGGDYYYSFETYEEALEFSQNTTGAEEPLALVLQEEYISEREPGQYEHIKEQRITEWSVEFLKRPRRTSNTIPDFMSPNAPSNKLDILRGLD